MHVVYWIHTPNETDINTQGYVGVSGNFDKRLEAHKIGNGNRNVFEAFKVQDYVTIEIVLEGSEEECYNYEQQLRPTPFIGWNIAEGGSRPPSPKGDRDRAAKAAKSLKGREITWGDKISEARKGISNPPEAIARAAATRKANKVPAWNKGKKIGPQSISTLDKRSKSMKGKNGKRVMTPLGTFNTITEAAEAHNVKVQTIHARIKYYKLEGYVYVE
jgi:predicted GIY-YIG superfamily endonuclease